ncbi:MAG TPA: hypothetical protein PLE77_09780 [Kiritimatiellia bacterium]|nr:hypothetical protein [Kiritimatiellia bacterium]
MMSHPSCLRKIATLCLLAATLSAHAEVCGTNRHAALNELSGLAASRQNPGVLWVHNDSGDLPRLFAITPSGALLGTYTLAGAEAVDWEDIAIGRDPASGVDYLYVGDIGDNPATRASVAVYRVPEPVVDTAKLDTSNTLEGVECFPLVYEDGAHNAETLMIDPWTGDIIVMSKTKKKLPSGVYRAAYPHTTHGTNALVPLVELPVGRLVAGDISPSGRQILVKDYKHAWYFSRAPGQPLVSALTNKPSPLPYVIEEKGEAIGWDCNEQGYYTASEGLDQPIHHYVAPR